MDAREALRLLIGFRESLDGLVKLETKVGIASEATKVESFLGSVRGLAAEAAAEASSNLLEFMRMLPDYDNRDFKLRRRALNSLGEAIRFSGRVVAVTEMKKRDDEAG